MTTKKIVLAGGTGFIGSYLARMVSLVFCQDIKML